MIEQIQKYAPTLNTVIMVENTLQNSTDSVITVAQLKKIIPKKINHYTLKNILIYLEESNKIYVGIKGITWIHNTNKNLKKAIEEGYEL
jgi:hypothetical protein